MFYNLIEIKLKSHLYKNVDELWTDTSLKLRLYLVVLIRCCPIDKQISYKKNRGRNPRQDHLNFRPTEDIANI